MLGRLCLVMIVVATVVMPTAVGTSASAVMDFAGADTAELRIDATITGEEAKDVRQQMDESESGNGDGTVSASEVDQFEVFTKAAINEFGAGSVGLFGGLEMDDKQADTFEASSIDFTGAEALVTSTAPISAHLAVTIHFPIGGGDRHTLTAEAPEDRDGENPFAANVTSFKLKAPDGHKIESATGLPAGVSPSSDGKEIDFGSKLTPTGTMTIVFVKSKKSPDLGILAIVAGVAIALFLAARRPRP